MVAEGRVGSNQSLLISLAAEAIRELLSSLKPKSDKKTAQEHTRDHEGNTGRTCWIHQKNHTATEPMNQHGEDREGRLRELSVRWFMDTQAPLILRNGIFPSWFQGFITRKDAEKTLHDKELGSFLIRLSDKATGYILSYKGSGRCRHFMISQTKAGQFVVSGDTRLHESLVNLIAFYKKNSIEPFGEYLTYSCLEECAEELYDMIQVSHREKSPVNPRARTPATAAPQGLQDREETPPIPRRRRAHVDVCGGEAPHAAPACRAPAESAPGRAAWLETESTSCSAASTRPPPPLPPFHLLQAAGLAVPTSAAEPPRTVYSLLQPLEGKSASLPLLLDTPSDGDRLSTPPPRPSPRSSSPGAAQGRRRGKLHPGDEGRGGGRPASSPGLDYPCAGPVYHLAGAGQPQARGGQDERVAVGNRECAYDLFDDEAYEMVPEVDGPPRAHGEPRRDSHTYESPEDIRLKPLVPSAGAKNDKWKWFPELKRK